MSTDPQSGQPGRRRVLLFSGHMIDAPKRAKPRFPPEIEPVVARAIRAELDVVDATPGDRAISSAACGGDILFDEAVLERGVPLTVYLPFDESTFLKKSVEFANARWVKRYHRVVARAKCLTAPEILGPLDDGANPYERVNLWMLDEAQKTAGSHVVFICLWNGEGGDGPGGTKHMINAVRAAGGEVHWIDIRKL